MAEDRATAVTSRIVRPIRFLDVPKWLSWLWNGREKNSLDSRMFDYPLLKVVVVEKDGEATMMLPVHQVLMLDSAAFNPEADAKERLLSARQVVENVCVAAKAEGMAEVIYVSSDGRSDEFMETMGFKKTEMYRRVL